MPKHFWFKFEWDRWRNDPQLRRCSKETKGFWIDAIAVMEELDTYFLQGTIEDLCRDIVCTPDEFERSVAELKRTGAATISKSKGRVKEIVKIVSRKILKEVNLTEYNRLKQQESRKRRRVKTPVKTTSTESSKDIDIKSLREEEYSTENSSSGDAPPKKSPRGSRLPDQFFLTAAMREWALKKRPNVDLSEETEKFCNHFRSAPGTKGVKLDWTLTWKNWILNAKESNGQGNRNSNASKPTSTDRLGEYGSIIDQYPTEAELRNRS